MWLGITAGQGTQLEVWDRNLVGVEGSPLSVRGATTLDITLAGIVVRSDFLVAKTLSAKAIMGLDFLENNGCIINTGQRVMHLKGKAIPLNRESQHPPSNTVVKTCERL